MPTLMTFVLRLFLLIAGALFAASLAVAIVLMLTVWTLRAAWARLTGRPVLPFVVRIDPRAGFERMYRARERASRTPCTDASERGRKIADVTDVEPRPPSP